MLVSIFVAANDLIKKFNIYIGQTTSTTPSMKKTAASLTPRMLWDHSNCWSRWFTLKYFQNAIIYKQKNFKLFIACKFITGTGWPKIPTEGSEWYESKATWGSDGVDRLWEGWYPKVGNIQLDVPRGKFGHTVPWYLQNGHFPVSSMKAS